MKCPFSFDIIVVHRTALLYSAYNIITITKRTVAWVGPVQPECIVPLRMSNFRNFKHEFLLNGK